MDYETMVDFLSKELQVKRSQIITSLLKTHAFKGTVLTDSNFTLYEVSNPEKIFDHSHGKIPILMFHIESIYYSAKGIANNTVNNTIFNKATIYSHHVRINNLDRYSITTASIKEDIPEKDVNTQIIIIRDKKSKPKKKKYWSFRQSRLKMKQRNNEMKNILELKKRKEHEDMNNHILCLTKK